MPIELTMQELKDAKPGIIRSGVHPEIGIWVAVRGGITDWTVYAVPEDTNFQDGVSRDSILDHVATNGDKVYRDHALKLVSADDQAARMFRE